MSLSTATANSILNAMYRGGSFSNSTLYMSLHNGDPGTTGANELTDTNYARVDVHASWGAASGATISNNATINFQFLAANQTIDHVGFWDASTSGNFLHGFAVGSTVVPAGDRPYFSAGDLIDNAS